MCSDLASFRKYGFLLERELLLKPHKLHEQTQNYSFLNRCNGIFVRLEFHGIQRDVNQKLPYWNDKEVNSLCSCTIIPVVHQILTINHIWSWSHSLLVQSRLWVFFTSVGFWNYYPIILNRQVLLSTLETHSIERYRIEVSSHKAYGALRCIPTLHINIVFRSHRIAYSHVLWITLVLFLFCPNIMALLSPRIQKCKDKLDHLRSLV